MIVSLSQPFAGEKIKAQQALYKVIDPELFVNVIDLGLIYEVVFDHAGNIEVMMTLSTPHCPMGEAIRNGVRNALEIAFPEHTINVNLTFDPKWNFEMLTEEGRAQLGF